jgi:hypothetical protein
MVFTIAGIVVLRAPEVASDPLKAEKSIWTRLTTLGLESLPPVLPALRDEITSLRPLASSKQDRAGVTRTAPEQELITIARQRRRSTFAGPLFFTGTRNDLAGISLTVGHSESKVPRVVSH